MDRGPIITEEDVGSFMVDDHGDIWRVIGYTAQPTYMVEKVADVNIRDSFVVGCPNSSKLTKLKKENQHIIDNRKIYKS